MKLSIITINFNNLAGLQRTYDSVVCQTWTDYEWIIIDGGSTDGSREFIEAHKEKFAYWCSEPDKGIYNAMNKGVTKAQGDYLLFLNSGDSLYDSDVLEEVSKHDYHADIISCQAERMDTGKPLRHYRENVLMQLYQDTLNHQATFIRKSLLELRPYDENLRIVSDWKFWFEAVLRECATVQYSDIMVARQDMTGISQRGFEEERRKCLIQVLPPPLKQLLDDRIRLQNTMEYKNMLAIRQQAPRLYRMTCKMIAFLVKTVNHGIRF